MNDTYTLSEMEAEHLLVVLHPTSFCNLDCRYCWAPDRDRKDVMSLVTLRAALERCYKFSTAKSLTLCWHSGEPLVVGLDYFKQAVELSEQMRPRGVSVDYSVQTNGTLINEAWVRFFKENGFSVGVSIDGPEEIHNQQRRNKSGRGTFDQVISGIEMLSSSGVKGGALCVITRVTLRYPADVLFHFFRDRSIEWGYLIEAKIGANINSPEALSLEDKPALRQYLDRLLALWIEYPDVYIKDFEIMASKLMNPHFKNVVINNVGCLDIVSINSDGGFFFGNPELVGTKDERFGDFLHGNVKTHNFDEARERSSFSLMRQQIASGVRKCKAECPYFGACRGGNFSHKYFQFRTFDVASHLTCELNEQVSAELLLSRLEKEAKCPAYSFP